MSAPRPPSDSSSDDTPPRTKSHSNLKWVELIHRFLKGYAADIVTFALSLFLGYIIATRLFASANNELSNGILASSEILLNKGLRGVFPPLSGEARDIVGNWSVELVNSL